MASFELQSNSCDGHIRALSRAILMASRISKEALLEFTADKMRLCARTEIILVKFTFYKEFFTYYECEGRHRCFVSLKALTMPFKSSVLVSDSSLRSSIKLRCVVEDLLRNEIVFKIGADQPATTLTYRLVINDLEPDRMSELNAINRTIDYSRVEISPKSNKKERFLLSAFNSFAPDIDQVTIKTSPSEVKFIGSSSPIYSNRSTSATSEFTHKKEDFATFLVKEDIKITVPLRYLKLFLNFVETTRIQTEPSYIFEGMGLPAHFIYKTQLFKAHFVSATPYEFIPDEIEAGQVLQITMGEPNESFIADENVIQAELDDDFELYNQNYIDNDEDEDDDDGYNDNQSECSEYLDGNLERLNPTPNNGSHHNNSVFGAESIRSEMKHDISYDPDRLKEALNIDPVDPDEIEKAAIQYSSDSGED